MSESCGLKELSIVVPVHNEVSNIDELYRQVIAACESIDFELIFVNDGSTDETAAHCCKLAKYDKRVKVVSLLKNVGHQVAIHAGLRFACGDYVAMMDGDLQHPPKLLTVMLDCARTEDVDVVNGVKKLYRAGIAKRMLSYFFYRIFNLLTGEQLVPGASDFRLISRRTQQALLSLSERRPFYRAMIPTLGFPSANIEYDVSDRHAGESSYTFSKSLRLAVDAFLYHSTLPLRLMTLVGFIVACSAFIYAVISIIVRLSAGNRIRPGWADVIVSILMLGGLNLIFLGLIGEYIAVLLEHAKGRPSFIVDEKSSTVKAMPEQDPGS